MITNRCEANFDREYIMKWSINGQELHAISRPTEIVETLNLCAAERQISGGKYYLLSEQNEKTIISNVPRLLYDNVKLKKYKPPSKINRKIKRSVENLQTNIDILHNNHPDASDMFEDGKVFQFNQCYHNSTGVFHLTKHLDSIQAVRPKCQVEIVLGYFTSKIPFGTNIADKVVESDSILLHDWHVWNYVNNILVDLSLFKNGNLTGIDNHVTSWGEAKDHVFIYPPRGIGYWGIDYSNYTIFNKEFYQYFESAD